MASEEKKLYKDGEAVMDISAALTPQKVEFIRAGGSYAIVFGKNNDKYILTNGMNLLINLQVLKIDII